MHEVENIVTDKQINDAWGNSDFGPSMSKRDIIRYSLLKCAGGYYTGHTAKCILSDLGLVTPDWSLSQRGQKYLFAAFSNGISV